MNVMAEMFFWGSFFLIFYTYIGYPLQLLLQTRFFPKPHRKGPIGQFTPRISIVVAARNEENNIAGRLRNLINQDYPFSNFEIIIVSDGSTDRTNDIVNEFITSWSLSESYPNLRLITYETSKGKPHALNLGVGESKGEFVVFADSRQTFKADAINQLIANFQDPTVGCVSGELVLLKDPDSEIQLEMGAYWRYEKMVRKAEGQTGSVVGATGCIYAIRKKLYCPLPGETLLDDVLTPMKIAMDGSRVVFDPFAVAFDVVSRDMSQEWRRKVRTLGGNWQLLSLAPPLFSPMANPLWLRFIAHKVLRIMVPFVAVALLISNCVVSGGGYTVMLLLQIVFYLLFVGVWRVPALRKNRYLSLVYFFVVLNAAAGWGFWKWASGDLKRVWAASAEAGR